MDPITESRTWLADQLAALPELVDVNLYPSPVEVVTAPAVILAPASDWIRPRTLGRFLVSWDVTVAVAFQGGNAAALDALTALVHAVVNGFPGAVLAPAVTKYGQADLYAATITVPTLTDAPEA